MRGNNLGPVDRTVHVLIDRSYPVVKAVYEHLDAIAFVNEKIETIEFVQEHFDEIEKIQQAADALIEIRENLDEIKAVNDNVEKIQQIQAEINQNNQQLADRINQVYENVVEIHDNIIKQVQVVDDLSGVIQIVADNIDKVKTVSSNINSISLVAGDLKGEWTSNIGFDMGMVGDPVIDTPQITGGNIKDVADHIEDVQTVAGLSKDGTLDDIIEASGKITEAVDAADRAEKSATAAKTSETNAKLSETKSEEYKDSAEIAASQALQAKIDAAYVQEQINQSVSVVKDLQTQAKQSEINAESSKASASNSAALAKRWATQTSSPVENGLYGAKYYAEQAKNLQEETAEKAEEALTASVTYYIPSVDQEGNLSWTNTGDKENPDPVNIKGPRGDQGEQGWSFSPTAVGTLEERSQHDADPKGSSFLDVNSGIIYFKMSDNSGDWNDGIPFRGQDGQTGASANEILMSPDPVAYFDEIYGKASGDIVGEIIISAPAIKPAPVETFENALK